MWSREKQFNKWYEKLLKTKTKFALEKKFFEVFWVSGVQHLKDKGMVRESAVMEKDIL